MIIYVIYIIMAMKYDKDNYDSDNDQYDKSQDNDRACSFQH